MTPTPSSSKEGGAFQPAAAEFSGKVLTQQCHSGQLPGCPYKGTLGFIAHIDYDSTL